MNYYSAGKIFMVLGGIYLIAMIIYFPIIILLRDGPLIPDKWGWSEIYGLCYYVFITFGPPIFYLIIGKAIQKHKEWARIVGIILAILKLIAFPIGTLIGGFILWCLTKGWNVK